jgi:FimV-like protein
MSLRKVIVTTLCCFATLFAAAQSNDEAAKALAAGDTAKAISLYKHAVDANPNDANGWEQLGGAYQQAAQYSDAAHAFQAALDKGYASPYGKYNLACAYARMGEKDRALDLLSEVVAKGVPVPMAGDPDLASLTTEPRFLELQKKAQAANEPCRDPQSHPEYRQFDFWVGEWDVFSGTQPVGTSSVQLILKDCVVFENWRALAGGSEGKSLNKYNSSSKKWEQFWVADNGGTTHYIGELKDGAMAFVEALSPKPVTQRLTFSKLSDGRVRQLGEQSSDGGKTWTIGYDFIYVKKKVAASK